MEHRYFHNEKLLKFYLWCIMRANWSDKTIMVGHQTITLQRGQFVFGLVSASEQLNMSIQTIRTLLSILVADHKINKQTTNKYTVITVIKYDTWQCTGEGAQHANQQTNNKQITTDNKNKNKTLKSIPQNSFPNAAEIFEKCWQEYPRREGRKAAERHFYASVKSVEEARELFTAIQNYKELIRGKDMQYVKQGSTFFNNWRDYVE